MSILLWNGTFGYFSGRYSKRRKRSEVQPCLTEVCFVPRRLLSLDIPALIKKKSTAQLSPLCFQSCSFQAPNRMSSFIFLLGKRKAASSYSCSVPNAPEKGARLSNSEHLAGMG